MTDHFTVPSFEDLILLSVCDVNKMSIGHTTVSVKSTRKQ